MLDKFFKEYMKNEIKHMNIFYSKNREKMNRKNERIRKNFEQNSLRIVVCVSES